MKYSLFFDAFFEHPLMGKTNKSKKNKSTMAQSADRHELYELAVQCAESEVDFVSATFKKIRGRKARLLREDFCGTANVCCEWVGRDKKNRAIGIDLDPEVLAWGKSNNIGRLPPSEQSRINLVEDNVLTAETESPDIISAMNFSYWLLKERPMMKRYFEQVHDALKDDGILFLDAYGGYDSFSELEEEREIESDTPVGDYTYTWEQASFNPINHDLTCHIHFAFNDGSAMNEAFTYHWRLWTLPEIQDILHEVGFKVTVYWQGWDKNGEADGDFYPATEADADAGWICYIAAVK